MVRFKKIVVCGVGLIGGSFALSLKAAGVVDEVVGLGRKRETLEEALRLAIIDRIADGWADALNGADLVLLGMPVGQMQSALQALAPHLGPDTVVTDAGSTKADVVTAARAALGDRVGQFVPGHPIAGAETSGPSAARADLYQQRRAVLTPLAENSATMLARVRDAWLTCGARVDELAPDAHDRVFAAVSHLPHLLAYALMHEFAGRDDAALLFGFAAGGFRDFTRIAGSHPEMWRDICIANRHALLGELDAYVAELLRLRVKLAGADAAGLAGMFDVARRARATWLEGQPSNGEE